MPNPNPAHRKKAAFNRVTNLHVANVERRIGEVRAELAAVGTEQAALLAFRGKLVRLLNATTGSSSTGAAAEDLMDHLPPATFIQDSGGGEAGCGNTAQTYPPTSETWPLRRKRVRAARGGGGGKTQGKKIRDAAAAAATAAAGLVPVATLSDDSDDTADDSDARADDSDPRQQQQQQGELEYFMDCFDFLDKPAAAAPGSDDDEDREVDDILSH